MMGWGPQRGGSLPKGVVPSDPPWPSGALSPWGWGRSAPLLAAMSPPPDPRLPLPAPRVRKETSFGPAWVPLGLLRRVLPRARSDTCLVKDPYSGFAADIISQLTLVFRPLLFGFHRPSCETTGLEIFEAGWEQIAPRHALLARWRAPWPGQVPAEGRGSSPLKRSVTEPRAGEGLEEGRSVHTVPWSDLHRTCPRRGCACLRECVVCGVCLCGLCVRVCVSVCGEPRARCVPPACGRVRASPWAWLPMTAVRVEG